MSGLCGAVGQVSETHLHSMLGMVPHRGETVQVRTLDGAGFGVRSFAARARESTALVPSGDGILLCAGGAVPGTEGGAEGLVGRLERGETGDLDGRFVVARWSAENETLTLWRDPFGLRSIYWTLSHGTFWFATELKQLLAIKSIDVELDPIAIHKYLTFSFVPGEATPIAGIRRLLPGHRLTYRRNQVTMAPWFALEERIEPVEQGVAAKALWQLGREAVERRCESGRRAGLYLSGGIDSSAVGLWLKDAGAAPTALTLDFGAASVEREEATEVAKHLGLPLEVVPADPRLIKAEFDRLIWSLDMPFGDAVTGPQWLLGQAAKRLGLDTIWNGEGGDQLFGGWTTKPMVAAAVYGIGTEADDEHQQYLKSYHRFYGLEAELYTPELASKVTPGQRRAIIARFLGSERAQTFLNRVRLTDISLKGSHNILPRAERIAAAHGLDLHMPLFDRRLAEWSFTLPTALKLQGACEKYVMKLALQNRLSDEIVWRRKYGMSVPITDWVLGPLAPLVSELLSDASVKRRGLFQVPFVAALRAGKDVASETRRRRLGERLWALVVLEAWCRRFIDQRGRAP